MFSTNERAQAAQRRLFTYVPVHKRLLHVPRLFNHAIVTQTMIYLPQGPTKSVTASTIIPSTGTFYAGSYDGRIISGSIDTGVLENLNEDGHTNLVSGLTGAEGGRAWSVGYDDKIREITANGFV